MRVERYIVVSTRDDAVQPETSMHSFNRCLSLAEESAIYLGKDSKDQPCADLKFTVGILLRKYNIGSMVRVHLLFSNLLREASYPVCSGTNVPSG